MSTVLLIMGLPASGKTTIGKRISEMSGAILLDGDEMRENNKDLGFSRKDRLEQIWRAANLAVRLANAGKDVVISLIAPYEAGRRRMRAVLERAGHTFHLVYLRTPLSTCEERDPKGLYAAARRGEIRGLTGLDGAFEKPKWEEVSLDADSSGMDIQVLADFIAPLIFRNRIELG